MNSYYCDLFELASLENYAFPFRPERSKTTGTCFFSNFGGTCLMADVDCIEDEQIFTDFFFAPLSSFLLFEESADKVRVVFPC